VLQRVSSDLSIFVYVYIILFALLILLLSYYSTLIASIRVKTCLRIFNWYILVAHLIPLSLYVIWLFESFYNILIFNPFCFDSSKNKYKKYRTFFVSQTKYKIFLKIEWIINFSGKSKKKIIKWCFCETIFKNHKKRVKNKKKKEKMEKFLNNFKKSLNINYFFQKK